MKCPKCGFVSFPGHEECKKCGHRFTQVNGRAEGIPPLFHHPSSETEHPSQPETGSALDQTELGEQETAELDVALEPQNASSVPTEPEPEKPASPPSEPPGPSQWQTELAERVQEYRQRRAHFRKEDKEEEGHKTFNFDFGSSPPKQEEPRPNVIEFPSGEEGEKRPKPKPEIKSAPPSFGMGSFESAFKDNDEAINPPPPPEPDSRGETGPLEIELGPSEDSSAAVGEGDSADVPIAHMNRRFFAGLIDALVLLSGAAIFALIFWRFGGSFSPGPMDLVAAAAIGAFFTLLYFAGCTAFASATPGLIWAGLEVITFEGNPPGLSHCLWRGVGYLVSTSALMLGFIWAVVDAEGLTWHDRMSRTFVVPAERP